MQAGMPPLQTPVTHPSSLGGASPVLSQAHLLPQHKKMIVSQVTHGSPSIKVGNAITTLPKQGQGHPAMVTVTSPAHLTALGQPPVSVSVGTLAERDLPPGAKVVPAHVPPRQNISMDTHGKCCSF